LRDNFVCPFARALKARKTLMEIISLGHAGFRLRGKDATIVIDPPSPPFGYPLKGISADVVCVSHDHPGHSYVQGIGGTPYIVRGPGEYEVSGVLITGLRAFHDSKKGEERGGNTIYIIHADDLVICHLGDLGHPLNATQQQATSGADVLMIPVGGHSTINAAMAAEIIGELEPSVIIPMHYRNASAQTNGNPLDPVDLFIQAMGVPVTDPVTKLQITRSTVPAEPQVVILSPRG
jgi:L-ascorbate metabolism protein UlaG (beta-lactamase superfamily)